MILNILSSQLILATLTSASIFFDPTAVKHSCVNSDGSTLPPGVPLHLENVDTTLSEQTILLKPIGVNTTINGVNDGNNGGGDGGVSSMCVLHRWTTTLEEKAQKKGFYFPLGRSQPSIPGEVWTTTTDSSDNSTDVEFGHSSGQLGDWTRPPGKASRQLEYICGIAGNSGTNFDVGEYLCEVTLPTTSKPNAKDPVITDYLTRPYFLTYYERSMSVRNELSRFLQKNTFGPTKEELDELETRYYELRDGVDASSTGSTSNNTTTMTNTTDTNTTTTTATSIITRTHSQAMTLLQQSWVSNQMDPTTFSSGEFTSLRAYWRRRLNPRKEETYRIGESGPHPCERHSHWRKYAFTNFDVQNSKMLRWGNQDLGGSYQTQRGHRITVETVEYWGPPVEEGTGNNVTVNVTKSPTISPTMLMLSDLSDNAIVTLHPTSSPSLSSFPTISSAPTAANILNMGDMEGRNSDQVKNQWPSRCNAQVISNVNTTANSDLVAQGDHSLYLAGGKKCFLFRPVGTTCGEQRVTDPIKYGDVLHISAKVRISAANQVFQMYTGHYHVDKGRRRWALPTDDSHMIARTLVPEANTWTTIEAMHKVGADWMYDGQLLEPQRCNHYHLRFRVANSEASWYIDDVKVSKVSSGSSSTTAAAALTDSNSTDANSTALADIVPPSPEIDVPTSGFFANPNFDFNFQFWKYAPNSGYLEHDPQLDRNVMVMKRGHILRQNIYDRAIPAKKYQFHFFTKVTNTDAVDMRIIVRLRFTNNDRQNGPCPRPVCNFYKRPLARTIKSGNGEWQEVVTEEFEMFGNYTEWDGKVDFILFQLVTKNMDPAGEFALTGFADLGDTYTEAPSVSLSPSAAPSRLFQQHVGYVIRYADEVRTVIRYPFQIDRTGEKLDMTGGTQYQLCEVDEVEGRKAEFPNRMNFWYQNKCQPIRHGNPAVNLDPNFVNMTDLHLLDISDTNTTTVIPINVNQTFYGDWLLETPVQDDVCASFPTPYDNDYRGADPVNPDDIPTRFVPDKPVFGRLPDGTYALYDSRLVLHGNTLENPVMDGGGNSVLRSTLRAHREGLKTLKYPWAEEYYVFNDHNIALCSNEQPNFLNIDHCVLSYEENVCVKEYLDTANTLVDVQLVVTFDAETLANLHEATRASYIASNFTGTDNSRYLYAVDNLRWDESVINANITVLPCVPENPVSRWKPRPDLNASECTNTLTNRSNAAFVHSLETSNDENPYLRDIYLWNDKDEDGCDEIDYDQYGMLVMTEEGCWENMHPDYMSIYDFTGYEAIHPVNITNLMYLNTINTNSTNATDITEVPSVFINNWTEIGIIQYPDSHPMSYFEELKEEYGTILAVERYSYASTSRVNQGARFGDSIILDQFADQMRLNTDSVILAALAKDIARMDLANNVAKNRGGGTLVCGSPNEVAPDPTLDDYFDVIHRDLACIGCMDSYGDYSKQKATVWAMNVLEGEDQLCQRMAWSLYELLNVGAASNPDNTESNLYTYDIFNRHCFGSYFDILKELTYSPKMGEQFNFAESTSSRLQWDTSGTMVFPDENYAREVMQLYTIGLHELNPDGTETRDEFGRLIQTYTNLDILSNSRIMTGFTFTARRGNIEELFRSEKSRQDPLRIEVDKHDFFPKSSVDGGWIGDRFPLCVDLPKYHFLKIGAKYQLRGDSSLPRLHHNPPHWDSDESIKRFVLSKESPLYEKLCNPVNGTCQYANTITLDSNLACHDKECRIDTLQTVQVEAGTFYEYVRQPCVDLSFYPNPKKVITGFAPWVKNIGRRHTHAMCADPRLPVAARSCCNIGGNYRAEYNYDFEYHGERVILNTNLDQCLADNGTVCDPVAMKADNPLVNIRPVYNYPYPSQNTFFWTDSNCTQTVKVREDGMIAIINEPARNPWFAENTVPFVDLVNTVNYISVTWEKDTMTFVDIYPNLENNCGEGACTITADDACLCSVMLSETPVFISLPTREDVLANLTIGAFDPSTFSNENVTYSLLEASDGVEAYVSSDSNIIGATSTIFKLTDEFGDVVFFKNMLSTITLGNTYELRNPPSFINLVKVELRDAEYEVDAFLTSLIRYPSSAPFISKKLIQYHGISNPTPGFVHRVTQAFISGSFTTGGITFGNQKYGNLKAVAAAIALDPESLTPVTDEDPVNGNIREPLLKLVQFMRSLSFKRRPSVKFRHGLFEDMSFKMGQMVFDPPDQFSFFATDYSPPGVFAEAEMVSPESELLSMSSVVGLTNGLTSFVNYGLANADGGFGPSLNKLPPVGDYSTSMGFLTFPYQTNNGTSISSKIDELSTMMTAGRLSAENKQVILDAHSYFNQNYGTDFADRVLLKLMAASPEFHTSNTLRKTGSARPITPPKPKSSSPYKAIVYINLAGGADSFNILTPGGSGCSALYEDYWAARGRGAGIGLTASDIFNIPVAGISGCNNLGVNKLLSAYKDIYNEGKGVFFANMGHLHKPVTKDNWITETKTDLFSHHTMKFESHAVDAFREGDGPGVLGRMLDILEGYGHAVSATAVNSRAPMIDGSPQTGRLADVMSTEGTPRVFDRNFLKGEENQQLREFLEELHAETDDNSGVFGNAWSQTFVDIWNKTDSLVGTLRGSELATPFPSPAATNVGGITSQLKLIAKLINIRNDRGSGINRDVFYCEMGGYDAHFQVGTVMENKLPSLNHAVATFWAEMKAQGLENSVTVVQGSEFGRTITPNSNQGSDHAWGGNYFMFGGDVKGGKIMGEYPKSFSLSDPTNIGRGRLVPTTSWDALFYALTQWMGITDQDDIDYVLPNSQNFGCNLFTDYDLFNSGQQFLKGCGGATHETPITFQVPEIRMLTGEEQKQVCKLAMRSTSVQFSFERSNARCYVRDQNIVDSEIALGMYDVNGIAVLNFDTGVADVVTPEKVAAVSKATAATASDFVIAGALPQSEAPSQTPSMQPSVSAQPSDQPTMTTQPSGNPSISTAPSPEPSNVPSSSQAPSLLPSLSTQPSLSPSNSLIPSREPSNVPSVTQLPSPSPSVSMLPSISLPPTPMPTERKVFEEEFLTRNIGYVGIQGMSHSPESGLYLVEGSGYDIWDAADGFHYMYLESSGDVTFTVLIEGFDARHEWAKGGIMIRDELGQYSSHYSLFKTGSNGLANQYRPCRACNSYHYGTGWNYSSVWLRVVKTGNVLRSFYKPGYLERQDPWRPFGVVMSMTSISSNGYFIGIAVTSHDNSRTATLKVSNIQLARTCSSETITQAQCDQASNCESGQVSGTCYLKGEVPAWEVSEPVNSIFDVGSTVTSFGCSNTNTGNGATDATTYKFQCDRQSLEEPVGLLIKPSHNRMSIAEGLRVYAHNNCPNCDPVGYIFEGRTDPISNWVEISSGDLPWKTTETVPTRNAILGLDISSSYTSGDGSLSFTEVSFYNHDYDQCGTPPLQKDYRGTVAVTASGRTCQFWTTQSPHTHDRTDATFPGTGLGDHNYCRNPDNEPGGAWCYTQDANVRWEYCNVPVCEDDPATLDEYVEYKITWTGTRDETSLTMQLGEVEVPGLLGEEPFMPVLNFQGDYKASIVEDSIEINVLAGTSYGASWDRYAFDGTTNKFFMDKQLDPSGSRVQDRMKDQCWELNPTSGNKVMLTESCNDSNPNQRFYLTDNNEIRVNSIPGYCLDMRLDGIASVYFHTCHDGNNQKWIVDSSTEEIRSMHDNSCLDYDFNAGFLWFHSCHGGSNQKFFMNQSFYYADHPGLKVTPSHGRMSVVTGIRVYTANNNPGADPIKYSIRGRLMSGANIKTNYFGDTHCAMFSSYYITFGSCDLTAQDQRFELNDIGEIRVKNSPGNCLDPRYTSPIRFVGCFSDIYGVDDYRVAYQRWTLEEEGGTHRLKSVYYSNTCLTTKDGYMRRQSCDDTSSQQFYFTSGSFASLSSDDSSWDLISEGDLSWVSEFDRNPTGISLLSTYERGDENKYFMSATFYESVTPYYEYKIRFTETRDADSSRVQFGELELPGLLLSEYQLNEQTG